MCSLSDTDGSHSLSKTSSDSGSIGEGYAGKDYYQNLIDKADTVSLLKIFKYFNLRIDSHNRKITCPFKSHKNGHEGTASFNFYPETNSFFCFGCRVGGESAHACSFVAAMDSCNRVQAAYKIIKLFSSDINPINSNVNHTNSMDQLTIMMDFSNTVREFHQTHFTPDALLYAETACKKFDHMNLIHENMSDEALQKIVEQLKLYLSLYKE